MKILQINQTYRNGGSTGRIVHDLRLTQDKSGLQGFVVYGYSDGEPESKGALCLQRNKVRRRLNIMRTRCFDHHGFYNEHETGVALSEAERIGPDIIHLHNIHNHYIHVGKLFDYIKAQQIPVVWTLHDCWAFTGHCAYFDYAGCERWKTGCGHCPSLREYPPTWFFDWSRRNFEDKRNVFSGVEKMVLVTPSQWLADLTRSSYLQNYPVKVINNGVDTKVFRPKENNIKEQLGIVGKNMILAMASPFNKRKGIDYLLQMPSLLNEDEVLVIVGLEQGQMALLPKEKCIGVCRTSHVDELAAYYSAADVFVNPTLEDNFPTTNLESLACGTPVVTFRTGGSPESVDERTGLVVEKGDLNGMVVAVREVLSNGKAHYVKPCTDRAQQLYNKDIQYMRYIKLYRELYNGRL